MSTVCVDLEVLAGAIGATSNTEALAAEKTIVVSGVSGSITIEAGIGGEFCPVKTFSATKSDEVFTIVCDEMRVNAKNGGANSVMVAAERAKSRFTALPAPGGSGIGTAVDVKQFGVINSAIASPDDSVTVVEISQDPADPPDPNSFSQVFGNFTSAGKCQNESFSACWARTRALSGAGVAVQLGAQDSPLEAFSMPIDGIIYAPDIPNPSGNVYDNWEDAYAAAAAIANPNYFRGFVPPNPANTGYVNLYVDSTYSTYTRVGDGRTAAPIPAGTWDMTGIALVAGNNANDFSQFVCRVEFLDGAKVPGLALIDGHSNGTRGFMHNAMEISNASPTSIPIDGSFGVSLRGFARLQANDPGVAPIIGPFFGFLFLSTDELSQIGNAGSVPSPAPVIDFAGSAGSWFDNGSVVRDNTLTDSVGGAVMRYLKQADGMGIETPIASWDQPGLDAAGALLLGDRPAMRQAYHSTFDVLNSFDSPFDGKEPPILEIFDVDTSLYTAAYDGGNGTGFTVGEGLTFGAGGTGTVVGHTGDGVTGSLLYSLDSGVAPLDNETITGDGGGTALANGASAQNPVSLSLPRSAPTQCVAWVKDVGGNAAGANITVDLSIGGGTDTFEDGTQTDVLSTNYGAALYISNSRGIWRRMSI